MLIVAGIWTSSGKSQILMFTDSFGFYLLLKTLANVDKIKRQREMVSRSTIQLIFPSVLIMKTFHRNLLGLLVHKRQIALVLDSWKHCAKSSSTFCIVAEIAERDTAISTSVLVRLPVHLLVIPHVSDFRATKEVSFQKMALKTALYTIYICQNKKLFRTLSPFLYSPRQARRSKSFLLLGLSCAFLIICAAKFWLSDNILNSIKYVHHPIFVCYCHHLTVSTHNSPHSGQSCVPYANFFYCTNHLRHKHFCFGVPSCHYHYNALLESTNPSFVLFV